MDELCYMLCLEIWQLFLILNIFQASCNTSWCAILVNPDYKDGILGWWLTWILLRKSVVSCRKLVVMKIS